MFVFLFLVVLVSNVPSSLGHPFYVDSTPKPFQNIASSPKEVSVFFSEPIELSYSEISVIGSDGNRVDQNDASNVNEDTSSIATALKPNLPDGIYTVNTKVLSAVDGHIVDNSFTFGIGTEPFESTRGGATNGTSMPTTAQGQNDVLSLEESASRFPGYVGQVIVFGVAFASLWLWKPFRKVHWLSQSLLQYRALVSKTATKLLILGSGLVICSGIAMIIVQSLSLDASIQQIISTKFGNIWAMRMIQASILITVASLTYRKNSRANLPLNKAELIAILALALSLLVTYSMIAHAAATNQPLAILTDFLHSVAASIWIGGLIFLAFAAVPILMKFANDNEIATTTTIKAATLSILIPRFSSITVAILGIIIVTGPLLLWSLESDLEITIASLYGKILIVKLLIGTLMISLGAYHQFVTQKKATGFLVYSSTNGKSKIISQQPKINSNLTRFARTLKAEAGLGVALLVMVSLMANMALPSGEFPSYERTNAQTDDESLTNAFAVAEEEEENTRIPNTEFSQTAYVQQNGKIELTITPFTIGQNRFEISFLGIKGDIIDSINSSTVKLTQIEKGIGPIPVDTTTTESRGKFVANAAISLPGRWAVEVQGETTKPNTPNMVAIFDVLVKPRLSDLEFNIEEYKTPQQSLPLYPIYDPLRRSIWIGDTMPESGRIWQFNTESKDYTIHPINNTSLVTITALDWEGNLWYLDPTRSIIGKYDPVSKQNQQFVLPLKGIISGLVLDYDQNAWITVGGGSGQSNNIVRLSPKLNQLTIYDIPTKASLPTGIAVDRQGNIWFTESSAGKVGRLDPATGNITEYQPIGQTLDEPTAILADPKTSKIYISEHEGKAIIVLDPVLSVFQRYPIASKQGLPFGMALDDYGNLWFAQHVIDKVGSLDPSSTEEADITIPTTGSFVQWLVADDQGRIWFAEQRGSALGSVSMISRPAAAESQKANGATQSQTQQQQQQEGTESASSSSSSAIPDLNFDFADVLGPLIAAGIVLASALYSKNVIDLKRNTRIANDSRLYTN
jgi:copper transport protein